MTLHQRFGFGRFKAIEEQLDLVLKGQQKIMATLSDVQGAITALGTSVAALIAAEPPAGVITSAQADGLVTSLTGLKATVDGAVAALTPTAPTT